ncbi:MAG: foldase [Polyangiaceae bacterium]|nr:foldase [Polyangiaceae bacterium]
MVACVAMAGCGGGSTTPSDPGASASTSGAAPDAGPECIELANAPHEKRAGEPETITVSHVLVKHTGSKNPPDGVTRTRAEACLRAAEARDKLRGGADFGEVVKTFSDEPGAASVGGSIGQVTRSRLLPPFADAAFELDRAQLSDVVETEYGFHVILRTE